MSTNRSASYPATQGRSYSDPLVISYNLGTHDFGAGGDALAIPVPAGMSRFKVLEVAVSATEDFTAVSTPAFVRIGTAADADAFVEADLGTLEDTDAFGLRDDTDAIKYDDFGDADGLDQLEVAFVAPTGGSPAGTGHVNIAIAWF